MNFTKMHGIGNDYVYLDAFHDPALEQTPDLSGLARRMSDRHTGIGSDGLILVCRPRAGASGRMRMFNLDGSESEMCGNGIRCVAKFLHDRCGITERPMRIETGRGVLSIDYKVDRGKLVSATVDMGEPILDLPRIGVDPRQLEPGAGPARRLRAWRVPEGDSEWVFVSMGNPHAVSWTLYPDEMSLHPDPLLPSPSMQRIVRIGPDVERHAAFPNRINVHIARAISRREARMCTWERGAGPTLACGTGACAVAVAGVLVGCLDREVLLHLPGGDLEVRWEERSNHVFMTGPAVEVFEGVWPENT